MRKWSLYLRFFWATRAFYGGSQASLGRQAQPVNWLGSGTLFHFVPEYRGGTFRKTQSIN